MKLSLPRATLNAALAQAARVAERRNTIPILGNVRLDAADDSLRLTATDLDIEVRIRCEARIEEPGATTAPVGVLSKLTDKMPDGEVSLSLSEDGATLTVACGRSRVKLQCLTASDFPDLAADSLPHVFEIPGADLAAAIEAVAFAMSDEEIRYYLQGVFMHSDGEHLVTVATDGHRLSRWRGNLPSGAAGIPGIIIPSKTVGEMVKLIREGGKIGDRTAVLAVSDAKIRMEIGGTVLTSKLIDGTFPDYARVIPSGNDTMVELDRAAVAAAVDRVTTLSAERGRSCKLTFEPGHLRIDVVNPDRGSASEELDAPGDANLEIGFNGGYLAGIFASLGSDTVTAKLAGPGDPTLFLPTPQADDSDRLIVLMPMRV